MSEAAMTPETQTGCLRVFSLIRPTSFFQADKVSLYSCLLWSCLRNKCCKCCTVFSAASRFCSHPATFFLFLLLLGLWLRGV